MKVYRGRRLGKIKDTGSDVVVIVQEYTLANKGQPTPLHHHVYHSPTGFSWGYGGSGPSDLAMSILWDYLGKEPSSEVYQNFKWEFVAKWKDEWAINSDEIETFLKGWEIYK